MRCTAGGVYSASGVTLPVVSHCQDLKYYVALPHLEGFFSCDGAGTRPLLPGELPAHGVEPTGHPQ